MTDTHLHHKHTHTHIYTYTQGRTGAIFAMQVDAHQGQGAASGVTFKRMEILVGRGFMVKMLQKRREHMGVVQGNDVLLLARVAEPKPKEGKESDAGEKDVCVCVYAPNEKTWTKNEKMWTKNEKTCVCVGTTGAGLPAIALLLLWLLWTVMLHQPSAHHCICTALSVDPAKSDVLLLQSNAAQALLQNPQRSLMPLYAATQCFFIVNHD